MKARNLNSGNLEELINQLPISEENELSAQAKQRLNQLTKKEAQAILSYIGKNKKNGSYPTPLQIIPLEAALKEHIKAREKAKRAKQASVELNNRILRYYKECNFIERRYESDAPTRSKKASAQQERIYLNRGSDRAAINKAFEKDIEKMIIHLSLEGIQALQKRHLNRPEKTARPEPSQYSADGPSNSFSYTPAAQPRLHNKKEVEEVLAAAIKKLECIKAAKEWINKNNEGTQAQSADNSSQLLDKIIDNMVDMPIVERDPAWMKTLQNSDLRQAIAKRIIERSKAEEEQHQDEDEEEERKDEEQINKSTKKPNDKYLLKRVVDDKPHMLAMWLKTPTRGVAAAVNKLFEVKAASYKLLKSKYSEPLIEQANNKLRHSR